MTFGILLNLELDSCLSLILMPALVSSEFIIYLDTSYLDAIYSKVNCLLTYKSTKSDILRIVLLNLGVLPPTLTL